MEIPIGFFCAVNLLCKAFFVSLLLLAVSIPTWGFSSLVSGAEGVQPQPLPNETGGMGVHIELAAPDGNFRQPHTLPSGNLSSAGAAGDTHPKALPNAHPSAESPAAGQSHKQSNKPRPWRWLKRAALQVAGLFSPRHLLKHSHPSTAEGPFWLQLVALLFGIAAIVLFLLGGLELWAIIALAIATLFLVWYFVLWEPETAFG
mgnify:CR=1 FL=1